MRLHSRCFLCVCVCFFLVPPLPAKWGYAKTGSSRHLKKKKAVTGRTNERAALEPVSIDGRIVNGSHRWPWLKVTELNHLPLAITKRDLQYTYLLRKESFSLWFTINYLTDHENWYGYVWVCTVREETDYVMPPNRQAFAVQF